MVMFILSTHAPLAFEASKFEFSKGETLECRYARPFLLGGKEFLFVPKTLR
jgi:hypothetical protein